MAEARRRMGRRRCLNRSIAAIDVLAQSDLRAEQFMRRDSSGAA
jgi:hypothetical protein